MPRPRSDDPLDPLPPLDGAADDAPEPQADGTEIVEDETEATLDDTTGEDDPTDARDAGELDIEGEENGWLIGAGEALNLDVGAAEIGELDEPGGVLEDLEEAGGRDEELGFEAMPERGGLDAGEEGPVAADEELREADLPAMDADEEGELDDEQIVGDGFASDEPLGLQWSAQPWLRVGAPLALSAATAVACAPRGALVVGRSETGAMEMARIDLEGTCERLPAEGLAPADLATVRRLAVEGDIIVAVLEGGQTLVSWHGGASFAPLLDDVDASDGLLASGTLWVRTRAGTLLIEDELRDARRRPLETLEGLPNDGPALHAPSAARGVAALAYDGTRGMAALVVHDAARPTAVVRGLRRVSLETEAIHAPEARAPALLAACGGHLAYARRRGGVIRRRPGGEWLAFAWEGRVTALAFVDDDGTLLAATYSELDDTTALVRLDSHGQAAVVARLGAAPADVESDGRVVSMAHDEARGVVWVAGGFGVAVFSVR